MQANVKNKLSIENTSSLGRRITFNVPAEKLAVEEQAKIAKYAKGIRIDGFRKGKVPLTVIKQRYGDQVHQEVVSEELESSLKDALITEKLHPVGQPKVEEIKDNKGDDLQFVVSFEVFPEVELKDFSEVKLEKSVATITDEEIKKTLDGLQDQFATWKDVKRKVKSGDKVTIDFVGKIDGEVFEHGSATDFDLEIGSNKFIPGFEEGLIGASAEEKINVKVTFPTEYGEKSLAGKDAVFETSVKEVSGKTKAKIDEEFAKKIGIDDGDVAKINDKVRENMEKQLKNIVAESLRQKALDGLLEIYSFDLPETLVEKEEQNLSEELKRKDPNAEVDQEKLKEDAKKRTTMAILLQKIIEQYKLQPEESRIQRKLDELSSVFGNADMVRKIYTESKDLYDGLKSTVLTEQVADLIVEGATIKEKQSTFHEIANQSS